MTRHLLDLDDIGPEGVVSVIRLAAEGKTESLAGSSVAMVFEKPSARTRNATEMAVVDLGGHPVMITDAEVGIDRRETAEDVARTLGCYHQIIAARVNDHEVLVRMRAALDDASTGVSVVNLLSDRSHPCQAIADMLTILDEHGGLGSLGALSGQTVTYVGDANNVTISLAQAALSLGINVRVAAPQGYQLDDGTTDALKAFGVSSGANLTRFTDPTEAATGADILYTDVWTSMGQEAEAEERRIALGGYSISEELLEVAGSDAIVLHCLPAHRGEEIAAIVLEGPRSRVWRQAAHRRTAMLGIFRWVTGEDRL
jgi:ornithine carbamoyltransferase